MNKTVRSPAEKVRDFSVVLKGKPQTLSPQIATRILTDERLFDTQRNEVSVWLLIQEPDQAVTIYATSLPQTT